MECYDFPHHLPGTQKGIRSQLDDGRPEGSLIVRVNGQERVKVLLSPGVPKIAGNGPHCTPIEGAESEFIRSGL